jgi:hypothetical protein
MDSIGDEWDKVWGMPDFYESVEREIEPGIKVVSLPEVSEGLLVATHKIMELICVRPCLSPRLVVS